MQYHLVLTERCNLNCTYCGGTRHIEGLPLDPTYSIEDLETFISGDPEPVIGFYGGEPTLALGLMAEVMDNVPAKAFTLQTNGTRLSEISDEYLHRLHSILVSIDGGKEVTDHNRGAGAYEEVLRNVRDIRSRGYKGDLVARMAYSNHGDIYRDVCHTFSSWTTLVSTTSTGSSMSSGPTWSGGPEWRSGWEDMTGAS
jgi:MoaA/NifB/PqqE/SkfB family radical SAM enzyme